MRKPSPREPSYPPSLPPRGRPKTATWGVPGLAALLLTAAAASAAGPSQEDLDRIQRECLRAYTPEQIAGLTSDHETEIPADVDADPKQQTYFLDDLLRLEKGRFLPFPLEELLSAFKLYVKPGVRFLDLGSGDGRVVFLAALLGADAHGIEYDKEIFQTSRRALGALEGFVDPERVHLKRGDFFKSSWSGYDVIFYFDQSSFEQGRLRKKIAAELDPGARLLVGYQRSEFPGLMLETTFESLHVYRKPEVREYDATFQDRCFREVVELHGFVQDWLNGSVERSDEAFERVAGVTASGFTRIGPEAGVSRRAAFLDRLRRGYGSWREKGSGEPGAGSIRIDHLRLRLIEGPLAVVVYDERQDVRGKVRVRRTTALLRLVHGTPNGVEWYYLHQTRVP